MVQVILALLHLDINKQYMMAQATVVYCFGGGSCLEDVKDGKLTHSMLLYYLLPGLVSGRLVFLYIIETKRKRMEMKN